jgi:hypothetical protein
VTHTHRRAAAFWTISVVALVAPAAPAQTPTVRNVADSTQPFFIFTRPAINDAGTVAFLASTGVPGDPNQPARAYVYRADASGALTPVEVPVADVQSGQRIALDNSGTTTWGGRTLMRVAPNGTVTRLADTSGPFAGFGDFAAPRARAGPIVFEAALDGVLGHGVFNGPDPVANRLDNPATQTQVSLVGLGRSDAPRFLARQPGGGGFGVYDGPDLATDRTLDLSRFSIVEQYTENDRGDILFMGSLSNGVNGLYNGPDPVANRITDTTGALWAARAFLNDNGQFIIFGQEGQGGRAALYSGTNPATDRILGLGDPLFGSTLQSIGFNLADQEAFNNRGELAFGYTLANGVTGVAVLTVPEPAALGLLPAGLLLRRRRR